MAETPGGAGHRPPPEQVASRGDENDGQPSSSTPAAGSANPTQPPGG